MPESLSAIALPLSCGLMLSLLLDIAYAFPRAGWKKRVVPGMLAHVGIMAMIYAAGLLVFQRPRFAAVQMLIWQFVIVAVSYVKHRSLREVFLFQDFEYFSDMVKHPRLYIPFFGVGNIVLILAASAALIYTALAFESGLPAQRGYVFFFTACAALFAGGWLLLRMTEASDFAPTFDPNQDVRTLGLFGNFVAYARAERQPLRLPSRFVPPKCEPASASHLVVVQSESFFDARRVHPDIHPDVYAWLDRIRESSQQYGTLRVPAWGANTVRSEFAFLSGHETECLGVHRFNPYRRLGEVQSLAHALKQAGYRTVCVHPYIAGFYGRDRILPKLGFDEFVDVSAFGPADYSGPYIGDRAVAARVSDLLVASDKPLFVFAITMENHGPLHLERTAPGDIEQLYAVPPPPDFDDLTIYLRHIRNAGVMQQHICETLQALNRDAWLCWYGDHVPIMPKVYRHATFIDGRSDYFIWRSGDKAGLRTAKEIDLVDLGTTLLGQIADAPC